MCEAARRFRMVAVVGLVLALAQGRAWGQEPIWERATDFMRRICELPCVVTAKEKPAAAVPPGIFAWEKAGAPRREFGAGVNSDAGLTGSVVLNERCFSLLSGPAAAGTGAPVLPDSGYGRLLIDLGVIADHDQLLAMPTEARPFSFWPSFFR